LRTSRYPGIDQAGHSAAIPDDMFEYHSS